MILFLEKKLKHKSIWESGWDRFKYIKGLFFNMEKESKKILDFLGRVVGGILVAFPLYYTITGNDMHWFWFFISMVIGLVLLTSKFNK